MKITILALTLFTLPAAAVIQTNGTIAVHLRAADFTTGQATWANVSTPAFGFTAAGTPRRESIEGAPCVVFGSLDTFVSPGNAPPFLCNNNPVSIETWVWNGNIFTAEPMVSWGTATGLRTGVSFNFAKCCKVAAVYDGAVSHNGFDQDWGGGIATPEPGRWHHLVYTWDGSTSRCYADGSLASSATSSLPLAVSTAGLIRIASRNGAGGLEYATLALGAVRIHTGALTAAQVENNFREEVAAYSGGKTPANAAQTCARLSVTFDLPPGPATTAAVRRGVREDHDELTAAVNLPPATTPATGTGTGVYFSGGSSLTAPYMEIPRAGIQERTAITIEFWATVMRARPGACLLSIGGTSAGGPVTAPGGSFTPLSTAGNALVLRCGDPSAVSGGLRTRGFSSTGGTTERSSDTDDLGRMAHHVITWEPSSAEWRRYEGGLLVDSIPDPDGPMGLNTDNCWLGRSLNSADENADVIFDELRLHNYALTQGEILLSEILGPELLIFPAAPATFATWSAMRGTAVNPNGDHDGNGVSNLVQFATDSDRDGMPNFAKHKGAFFDVFAVDPYEYWELSVPAETTGVTFTLEDSATLTGFFPSSLTPDPRPMITEDGRSRVLRWTSTTPEPRRMFRRVNVTQP